jgi:hypothetical protein
MKLKRITEKERKKERKKKEDIYFDKFLNSIHLNFVQSIQTNKDNFKLIDS